MADGAACALTAGSLAGPHLSPCGDCPSGAELLLSLLTSCCQGWALLAQQEQDPGRAVFAEQHHPMGGEMSLVQTGPKLSVPQWWPGGDTRVGGGGFGLPGVLELGAPPRLGGTGHPRGDDVE